MSKFIRLFRGDSSSKSKVVNIHHLEDTNLDVKIYNGPVTIVAEEKIETDVKEQIEEYYQRVPLFSVNHINRTLVHHKLYTKSDRVSDFKASGLELCGLIRDKTRLVLLGDAGAGKSEELINAFHVLKESPDLTIPIYKKLSNYTTSTGLKSYLPDFAELVAADKVVLLLDGFDEIQLSNRMDFIRQLNELLELKPEIRVVISSRSNFYESPREGTKGSIENFEPYYIEELSVDNAKSYYSKIHPEGSSEAFISEVTSRKIMELIRNPFYLKLLSEVYRQDGALDPSKAQLFERFISHRFDLDVIKFSTTYELEDKRTEILNLIQKLAISMELMAKNTISETETKALVGDENFGYLRFGTVFRKLEEPEKTWAFEHNNLQEYLAAKVLSTAEFENVLKIITRGDAKKVLPSWVNTISLLFGILKSTDVLYDPLLAWLIENDAEIIVQFELNRLTDERRNDIFKKIFLKYKERGLWIHSNNFNDESLVCFGDVPGSLEFILNEIDDKSGTRENRMNAMTLVGYFTMDRHKRKSVRDLLVNQLDPEKNDIHFIHALLDALISVGELDAELLSGLISQIGNRKNQYIRTGIYGIMLKIGDVENHIDYLLDGYKALDDKSKDDRDEVQMMGESSRLNDCFRLLKTPESIIKVLDFILNDKNFFYQFHSSTILENVVKCAIEYGMSVADLFDRFFQLFKREVDNFHFEVVYDVLYYFDKTNSRDQVYRMVFDESKTFAIRFSSFEYATILTPDLAKSLIDEPEFKEITDKDVEYLIHRLQVVKNPLWQEVKEVLVNECGFILEEPEPVDYSAIERQKTQSGFDILFDLAAFKTEVLSVFEHEKKESLTFDDLFEIRRNNREADIEDYYSQPTVELLRDLSRENQMVSKDDVLACFDKTIFVEHFQITKLYNIILNYSNIEISEVQKSFIIEWSVTKASEIDFTKALKVNGDRTTYSEFASITNYFSNVFQIEHSQDTLLDMLSFDSYHLHKFIGVGYLIQKLKKEDVINRMNENLARGIDSHQVYKNHIYYLLENRVKESYSLILEALINMNNENSYREEYIKKYFEETKDVEGVKRIFDSTKPKVQWTAMGILLENDFADVVRQYLLSVVDSPENAENRISIICKLIELGDKSALSEFSKIISERGIPKNASRSYHCLNSINDISLLPGLIELLEISYDSDYIKERFDSLNSDVQGGLMCIALVSEENLNIVKNELEHFIKVHKDKDPHVKFLRLTIERMENQFYYNQSQSLSVVQVKEKLKLLFHE